MLSSARTFTFPKGNRQGSNVGGDTRSRDSKDDGGRVIH